MVFFLRDRNDSNLLEHVYVLSTVCSNVNE